MDKLVFSMLDNKLFKEVRKFIFEYSKGELSPKIVYHNFKHSEEVVNAAFEIGKAEKISEQDLEILLLAAWFHDIGFVKGFENHEEESKKIVSKYLKKIDYSEDLIAKVCEIIELVRELNILQTQGHIYNKLKP